MFEEKQSRGKLMLHKRLLYKKQPVENASSSFSMFFYSNINIAFVKKPVKKTNFQYSTIPKVFLATLGSKMTALFRNFHQSPFLLLSIFKLKKCDTLDFSNLYNMRYRLLKKM